MQTIGVVTSCIMDLTFEVPELPRPGETVATDNFHTGFGGKGANQAVAAAKTGAKVQVIGTVGEDDFGCDTIVNFEKNNINTEYIYQFEEEGTGLASIYVDAEGENAIGVALRANRLLSAEHVEKIPDRWFEKIDIIAGVLEIAPPVLRKSFARSKESGDTLTVLNAAPAREIPEDLWQLTDVLIVNETEAEFYCGSLPTWEQPEPALEALIERGPEVIVLSLGRKGAIAYVNNEIIRAQGKEVDTVDTTGAGDAFIGRYVSSLATDQDHGLAINNANQYAARTVQASGTQKSFPTLNN